MTTYTHEGKFGLPLLTADLNPDQPRSYWIKQRINQLTRELKEQKDFLAIDDSQERKEFIADFESEIKGYQDYLNK
jgi:hypothetical protein